MGSIVFAVMLFSFSLFAQTEIKTQIHDIDWGGEGESPLIYLTTGQVVSYPKAQKSQLTKLYEGVISKDWFLLKLNSKREIISFEESVTQFHISLKSKNKSHLYMEQKFIPSILSTMEMAQTFFKDARTDAKVESQCYNRAHVWAYEWRTKKNLYSSKAWIFFTRRYIRKHKFEWWFHVAPMVHVVIDGKVKERVMDIKYAKSPLRINQWSDIFIRDNTKCPVVEKYTDYANYPESGSCFLMKSSMYYYQPVDLENWELAKEMKSLWIQSEVKHAYEEAFTPAVTEIAKVSE